MVLAMRLSIRRGLLADDCLPVLVSWLEGVGLPTEPPKDIPTQRWLELMGRDKKVLDGRLRLVLLREIGEAFVTSDVEASDLAEFLEEFAA